MNSHAEGPVPEVGGDASLLVSGDGRCGVTAEQKASTILVRVCRHAGQGNHGLGRTGAKPPRLPLRLKPPTDTPAHSRARSVFSSPSALANCYSNTRPPTALFEFGEDDT